MVIRNPAAEGLGLGLAKVAGNLSQSIPQIADQRAALAARPPPAPAPKPREEGAFRRNIGTIGGMLVGGPGGALLGRMLFDAPRAESENIGRQNAREAQQDEALKHNQGVKELGTIMQQAADARMEFTAKNTPRLFPNGWLRMQEMGALAIVPGKEPGSVIFVQAKLGKDGQLDQIFKSKADVDGFLDQVLGGPNVKLGNELVTPRGRVAARGIPPPLILTPGSSAFTSARGLDGTITQQKEIKVPPIPPTPPKPFAVGKDALAIWDPATGKWIPISKEGEAIRDKILKAEAAARASGGKTPSQKYVEELFARHADIKDALLGPAALSSEAATLGLALEPIIGRGASIDMVSKFIRGASKAGIGLEEWLDANGHKDKADLLRKMQGGSGKPATPTSPEAKKGFFNRFLGEDIG